MMTPMQLNAFMKEYTSCMHSNENTYYATLIDDEMYSEYMRFFTRDDVLLTRILEDS